MKIETERAFFKELSFDKRPEEAGKREVKFPLDEGGCALCFYCLLFTVYCSLFLTWNFNEKYHFHVLICDTLLPHGYRSTGGVQ